MKLLMTQLLKVWHLLTAGLVFAVLTVVPVAWPVDYWITVRNVVVEDEKVGALNHMIVDRSILRDFSGVHNASLRIWRNNQWEVYCSNSVDTAFRVDGVLPVDLNLRYWLGGKCWPLEIGRYSLVTTWTVLGRGFLPDKELVYSSPIFSVLPAK